MFKTKLSYNESEFHIFQAILDNDLKHWVTNSKTEYTLLNDILNASWDDNTDNRPDFLSGNIMIEMFEVDDYHVERDGRRNFRRVGLNKSVKDINKFIDIVGEPFEKFRNGTNVIVNQNTDRDGNNYVYSYSDYVTNFNRIAGKHLENVSDYKLKYGNKKLGFLILDDSCFYVDKTDFLMIDSSIFNIDQMNKIERYMPYYDKNIMKPFLNSGVDFILWCFSDRFLMTNIDSVDCNVGVLISDERFYNKKHSKKFNIDDMIPLGS